MNRRYFLQTSGAALGSILIGVDGGTVEITDHYKYGSPDDFLTPLHNTTPMTVKAREFMWENMV